MLSFHFDILVFFEIMKYTNDGARLGLKEETVNRWNSVEAYMQLTNEVLPAPAQSGGKKWPVREAVSKLVEKRFV